MGNMCGCGQAKREPDAHGDLFCDLSHITDPMLLWEKSFPMCRMNITTFHQNLNRSGVAKKDIVLSELQCFCCTPAWNNVFVDAHPFAKMLKALPEFDEDAKTLVYAPKRGADKKTVSYHTLLCLAVLWCDGTAEEKAAALV